MTVGGSTHISILLMNEFKISNGKLRNCGLYSKKFEVTTFHESGMTYPVHLLMAPIFSRGPSPPFKIIVLYVIPKWRYSNLWITTLMNDMHNTNMLLIFSFPDHCLMTNLLSQNRLINIPAAKAVW